MSEFPDITTFTLFKEKTGITYDNMSTTDKINAQFFKKTLEDGHDMSIGLFSHNNEYLYCAWGYKDEEHCSMHAIMGDNTTWLPPQVGCPIKIPIVQNGKIVGLKMPTKDGERTFLFS